MQLEHLIIVAGPSGAGKSTFMRQLAANQLSDEVSALLPSGVSKWKRLFFESVAQKIASQEYILGAIYHYNLNYEDPNVFRLLDIAKTVTVVTLIVRPERLVRQLVYRESRRPAIILGELSLRLAHFCYQTKTAVSRVVPSALMNRLRRMELIPRSSRMSQRAQGQLANIKCYRSNGWLDDRYQRWRLSMNCVAQRRKRITQVWLEPEPGLPIEDESLARRRLIYRARWRLCSNARSDNLESKRIFTIEGQLETRAFGERPIKQHS